MALIRLGNGSGETGRVVIADAVKLVYSAGSGPAGEQHAADVVDQLLFWDQRRERFFRHRRGWLQRVWGIRVIGTDPTDLDLTLACERADDRRRQRRAGHCLAVLFQCGSAISVAEPVGFVGRGVDEPAADAGGHRYQRERSIDRDQRGKVLKNFLRVSVLMTQ